MTAGVVDDIQSAWYRGFCYYQSRGQDRLYAEDNNASVTFRYISSVPFKLLIVLFLMKA